MMPELDAPNKGSKKMGFLFPDIEDSPVKQLEKNVLELND